MRADEWNKDIYIGSSLPAGFRINILKAESIISDDTYEHLCGKRKDDKTPLPKCPNCHKYLFPIFDFNCKDPRISDLNIWTKERLRIYVCPSCALYMKPYWIAYKTEITVIGGERDGGLIIQDINESYECRRMQLNQLEVDDYPVNEGYAVNLRARRKGQGIYHQIGGVPYRGGYDELQCCCCDLAMRFSGSIDYDDLNVPLYENGDQPVALIIGDSDCLNWFTCIRCRVVGIKWNH